MTGAFEKNSKPELCKCYPLCDFICLNRYYGWYISGGPEIEEAKNYSGNENGLLESKRTECSICIYRVWDRYNGRIT